MAARCLPLNSSHLLEHKKFDETLKDKFNRDIQDKHDELPLIYLESGFVLILSILSIHVKRF
jgi:hypothetical protein